jgi:MtN3 and saliva related transmembrane protein
MAAGEGKGKAAMDGVEAVGLLAGLLTTVAFVPQAAKTARSGSARDFSLRMLTLLVAGQVLWLAYGLLLGSAGLIAANIVSVALSGFILSVKLRRG